MILGVLVLTQPIAAQEDFDYWAGLLEEFLASGEPIEANLDFVNEVIAGMVETGPEPEETTVISGAIYNFSIAADSISIQLPERFGGETLTALLEGELSLFIEDFADQALARIWIVDLQEEITGEFVIPLEDGRTANFGEFTLSTEMIDDSSNGPDNPQGTIDTETGEFNLTYVINPSHPILYEMGVNDLGSIVINERGLIHFSNGEVQLQMAGSSSISSGYFSGTEVTYGSSEFLYSALVPSERTVQVYLPHIQTDDQCRLFYYGYESEPNRIVRVRPQTFEFYSPNHPLLFETAPGLLWHNFLIFSWNSNGEYLTDIFGWNGNDMAGPWYGIHFMPSWFCFAPPSMTIYVGIPR